MKIVIKMKGQFSALGPMSNINKFFWKDDFFFQRTRYVGLCGNLSCFMLDLLDYAKFIESAWLLGLRPLHMEKLAPVII
jgi:hypothetical protein